MNELNPIHEQVWWYAYRFDYGRYLPSFKRMMSRAYLNKVGPCLLEEFSGILRNECTIRNYYNLFTDIITEQESYISL